MPRKLGKWSVFCFIAKKILCSSYFTFAEIVYLFIYLSTWAGFVENVRLGATCLDRCRMPYLNFSLFSFTLTAFNTTQKWIFKSKAQIICKKPFCDDVTSTFLATYSFFYCFFR